MEKPTSTIRRHSQCILATASLVAACSTSHPSSTSSTEQALVAQCATTSAPAPQNAWLCPDPKTIECGETADTIYVQDSAQLACAGQQLSVSDQGPFGVGTHAIIVSDAQGGELCRASLDVVDTKAPTLTPHTLSLWPPNHKFHGVSVSDCVSADDSCDSTVTGEFIWASSDEPINANGDGNSDPDIGFVDAHHACVRSERQGPKDGRVYHLGVRYVDAAGNQVEGACTIAIDHDKRGVVGKDSGDKYRVKFGDMPGLPACDGMDGDDGGAGTGAAGTGAAGTGAAGTGAAGTGAAGTGAAGTGAAGTGAAGTGNAGTTATPVDAGIPQ